MTDMEARLVNARYGLAPSPKHGGMADLFKASDLLQGNQKVALKLFKQEYTHTQLLAEAFRRESEALRQLCHPHIVKLFDSGVDRETDRHFLVLEWIDNDLSEWIKRNSFDGWDSFYNDFGHLLLQALAFAHSQQVIHRDVKPRNILVDSRGQPKLADFGIAKIKKWINPRQTLQDWVSRPFSPPEWDDGSYTYTRDVYGFATIVLYCLVDVDLKSYDDLKVALNEVDVPDEIGTLLGKCLSEDPRQRPSNAIVLLEELDRVQGQRAEHWVDIPTYFLQCTKKSLESLRLAFHRIPDIELEQIVLDDLVDVSGFVLQPAVSQGTNQQLATGAGHFQVYGANMRYHLAIDKWTGAHFAILNAWRMSSSLLENNRWRSFQPKCHYKFGIPPDPARAARDLIALTQAIEEHEAEISLRDAERREESLYQIWDRILKAKTKLEEAKKTPLPYRAWKQEGTRCQFWIIQPLSEELIGQPRRVLVENRAVVIGEVECLEGDRLTLYVKEQYDAELPATGVLEFDVAAAQTALRRQADALDSVRFDRTVRPELRRLLARPDRAMAPAPVDIENFFQEKLDDAKKGAVRAACGSPDFLVVQGPPGTGKTTFIAETVLQYLHLHPKARVLLTSQTHVALDNAAEKIHALSDQIRLLRLGVSAEQKTSTSVRDLLLAPQMETWRSEVLARSDLYIRDWAVRHAIPRHEFDIARLLQEYLLHLKEIRSLREKIRDSKQMLPNEQAGIDPGNSSFPQHAPQSNENLDNDEIAAIRGDVARFEAEIRHHNTDKVRLATDLKNLEPTAAEILDGPESEIEEWSRILMPNSPDAQTFRQLLDIRTDWEGRFGKSDEFQAALIAAAHVIAGTCIGVVGVKGILDIDFDLCIVD